MEPRALRILLAFAVVYLIWGSTYLAIRVVVEIQPPFLSASIRFLIAGALMLGFAAWRDARLPRTRRDWAFVAALALTMLVGGNGLVTWSERWVESNQAALIVATSALWMAVLGTLGARGERLGLWTIAGLAAGFGGVVLLVEGGLRADAAPWSAYAALLLSPLFWAIGAVFARRYPVAIAPSMSAALQMLIAGFVLGIIGLVNGEGARWAADTRSLTALAYLIVFGSCIAYGAFFYLVHEVSPALLGTYAYVNPAIAVVLGWWLLDEHLLPSQLLGTSVILGSVILVSIGSSRRKPRTG